MGLISCIIHYTIYIHTEKGYCVLHYKILCFHRYFPPTSYMFFNIGSHEPIKTIIFDVSFPYILNHSNNWNWEIILVLIIEENEGWLGIKDGRSTGSRACTHFHTANRPNALSNIPSPLTLSPASICYSYP